jgi:hypothetical protein
MRGFPFQCLIAGRFFFPSAMFRRNGTLTGKIWAKWSWRSVYLEWVTQTYQNPTGILHDIQSIPPNEGWISIHGNIWRTMLWDMIGTYKYDYTIWSTTWNGVFPKCRGPNIIQILSLLPSPHLVKSTYPFPNENANFVVDPVTNHALSVHLISIVDRQVVDLL